MDDTEWAAGARRDSGRAWRHRCRWWRRGTVPPVPEPRGGGFLLHPDLGAPRVIDDQMLPPLTESGMSSEWLGLSDDQRDARLRLTWRSTVSWALERGADRVLVQDVMADRTQQLTWAAAARGRARGWLVFPDLEPQSMRTFLDSLFDHPVEVAVIADGELIAQVYETWDGIVVYGEGAAGVVAG